MEGKKKMMDSEMLKKISKKKRKWKEESKK